MAMTGVFKGFYLLSIHPAQLQHAMDPIGSVGLACPNPSNPLLLNLPEMQGWVQWSDMIGMFYIVKNC